MPISLPIVDNRSISKSRTLVLLYPPISSVSLLDSNILFLATIQINNIFNVMSAIRCSYVSVEQDGWCCRHPMKDHLIVHSWLGVRSVCCHTNHLSRVAWKQWRHFVRINRKPKMNGVQKFLNAFLAVLLRSLQHMRVTKAYRPSSMCFILETC
jgi:hypothetical protein